MLSESARMTTAEQARFRVNYPNSRPRAVKVVALDAPSEAVVKRLSQAKWQSATFLTALGVFKLQLDQRRTEKPGAVALVAAAIFVGLSGWMLYFALTSPLLNTVKLPGLGSVSAPLLWLGFILLVTLVYAAATIGFALEGVGGQGHDRDAA